MHKKLPRREFFYADLKIGMCKILLEGADEWKKMGRRSII
ncbi:hypothetical protein B4098_3228 [Heyndrickxia coagulans]|uniref:Uncharacterized protein n=1 Tax=Heyndrickxia coagulans TaxID=1398 RepID=A0A150JZB0_HEYCO|nr:hypothetical protein B4098_3228 [Heyndrickxia coagulans]